MKIKTILGTLLLCLSTQSAFAVEKMYGVIGGSYTDMEYRDASDDGAGFRFVVGHQFHRQWYVEAGFYQLADTDPEDDGSTYGMKADALYLGVLGKASNHIGELFYRLGVANVDIQSAELGVNGECSVGSPVAMADTQTLCSYDESTVAGIVGLGFDYYVAEKTFIRFEAEYFKGSDGFDTTVMSLGVRYNFN